MDSNSFRCLLACGQKISGTRTGRYCPTRGSFMRQGGPQGAHCASSADPDLAFIPIEFIEPKNALPKGKALKRYFISPFIATIIA